MCLPFPRLVCNVGRHTPLYYAARQNHPLTAQILREAGARFAGSDVEGGFVELGRKKLVETEKTEKGDVEGAQAIWEE